MINFVTNGNGWTIDKLDKFSGWMKYRFREYRRIIRRELLSIGCTNLDFDVYETKLEVNFKFNNIDFSGSININNTDSYSNIRWYGSSNCDELWIFVKSNDKYYSRSIYNIKINFAEKILKAIFEIILELKEENDVII